MVSVKALYAWATGPRGGKYYVTKSGRKVYGKKPPTGEKKSTAKAAKPAARSSKSKSSKAERLHAWANQKKKPSKKKNQSRSVKPTKLTLDRFAIHIDGGKTFREDVHAAIRKAGMQPFLKTHPVQHLIEGEHPDHPRALGLYGGGSHTVLVKSLTAQAVALGLEAKWHRDKIGPNAWTVRSEKDTPEEKRKAVTVHELSHHMHLNGALSGELHTKINEHFDKIVAGKQWVPSTYARTNEKEWFAEAHTAYVYHRAELRVNDPAGFEIVKRVRKFYGMRA